MIFSLTACIFLGVCVLLGTWVPVYEQLVTSLWAQLAIAGAVGVVAGGLAPRSFAAWLAWPVLVALAWGAFAFAAVALLPAPMVLRSLVFPLAASVGAAAGLAAWRMPLRPIGWRFLPIVLGTMTLVGIFFLAGPLARWGASLSRPVPAFTLRLLDGGSVRSTTLAGKTVVLSFWATWCKPCRKELPQLNALYESHYASRPDVVFYVVDEGLGAETPAKAKAFLAHLGVNTPAAFDAGGKLGTELGTRGVLPVRVVIGPQGRERYRSYGYDAADAGFSALRAAIAASQRAR